MKQRDTIHNLVQAILMELAWMVNQRNGFAIVCNGIGMENTRENAVEYCIRQAYAVMRGERCWLSRMIEVLPK